jgi:hypothetical protein
MGNKQMHQRKDVYQYTCTRTVLLLATSQVEHCRAGRPVVATGNVQHGRARSVGGGDRRGTTGSRRASRWCRSARYGPRAIGPYVVATDEDHRGRSRTVASPSPLIGRTLEDVLFGWLCFKGTGERIEAYPEDELFTKERERRLSLLFIGAYTYQQIW